jgi:hypothetical protein
VLIVYAKLDDGSGVGRDSARANFVAERAGVALMSHVAINAVQLFGANGYLAEYRVE